MSHFEIFEAAAQIRETRARQKFLDEACGHDAELRQRVEEMLDSAKEAEHRSQSEPSSPQKELDPFAETDVTSPGVSVTKSGLRTGVLGDYRIVREIGRGGMGVVYEAEQVSLGRRVALKVLPFAEMLDKTQLRRFKNEARAAASLDHPNVVQIHSVGSERGVHYYAMQLIDGKTVAELIAEERSRVAEPGLKSPADNCSLLESTRKHSVSDACSSNHDEMRESRFSVGSPSGTAIAGSQERARIRCTVELGIQAAEALEHAHQMGVVHRDIKPSNLLVDDYGNLWVADFGLAMIEADGNLTISRNMVGTVRYMSPEQMRGDRHILDHQTDIYSLGATLYEMLTLRRAFPERNATVLMEQVLNSEPIPPRKLRPSISRDLEIITLKAMARDREDRYTTAGELAADLRRVLNDEPIRAKPPSTIDQAKKWMRRHRAIVITAATTLLIAVLFASFLLLNERSQTLAAYSAEKEQREIAQRKEAEAQRHAVAADIARAHEAEAREEADREKVRALRARTDAELAQRRAEHEAASARQSEQFARHLLYAGDVRLAARAWEDGDVRHYMDLLDQLERRENGIGGFEERYLRQLGSTHHRSVTDGTGGTCYVRYSPDGSLIVTGQYDGSIRVVDTHSNEIVAECSAHEGLLRCIDFSPDGKRMVSTADDGMIRIWHFPECRPVAVMQAYQGIGFNVYFAAEGSILVSCGESPHIQLWDPSSGQKLGELTAEVSELRTMTVSDDGNYCAASGDGVTFVWDLQERTPVFRSQIASMRRLQFSPDGMQLAAATSDKRIHVLNSQTGDILATLEGHRDDIDGLAFHPAGELLASADRGGVIRTWKFGDDQTSGRTGNGRISAAGWPSCFRAHTARVWSLDFSPDGDHLLSGSKDGTVRSWNRRSPLLLRLQKSDEVMGITFTKSGDDLLVCQRDTISLWNRRSNEDRALEIDIDEEKLSIAITPDDQTVVFGDGDGNIHLWNRGAAQPIKKFSGHESHVNRIDISPNGRLMVTSSWDGTAKLWDFDSCQELAVFRVPPHCNDAVFSPNGELLAISSKDDVMLYDVSSKHRLHLLDGHQNTADCLAFSPDGRLLATGSHDRTIRVWDVTTGEVRHVIPAHRDKITAIAFSPDGRTVASGDWKGTVAFSHVETGRFLYDIQIAEGATRDLKFAANGEALAAAIGNQVVLLQVSGVPSIPMAGMP